MTNSFILEFNQFLLPFLPNQIWLLLEMFFGLVLFLVCIFQRVYIPSFKTSDHGVGWFMTKVGQGGCWGQAMMGLLTMVDAYWSLVNNQDNVHCMIILWCIASVFVKINVLMAVFNEDKKYDPLGIGYIRE